MDTTGAEAAARSIADELPWAVTFIDVTDQVCKCLNEENRDCRPEDGGDGYFFSVAEQVMHIADTRWECMSWLDGNDYSERVFAADYPGRDAPWSFREASVEEIIRSLEDSREKLNEILSLPAGDLAQSTPGLIRMHQERLEKLRADGKDTAELEARGPGTLGNSVMFIVAHEQSHRAVLVTTLRTHGHDVVRVA